MWKVVFKTLNRLRMSNHTTITVSWNDDRGETHNERFFNVVALGNFLKENPRLANELLYLTW